LKRNEWQEWAESLSEKDLPLLRTKDDEKDNADVEDDAHVTSSSDPQAQSTLKLSSSNAESLEEQEHKEKSSEVPLRTTRGFLLQT